LIRPAAKVLVEILGAGLAALAILAGLFVWRIAQGPLRADFLTPAIERALAAADIRTDIGGTEITWGGFSEPFELRARSVRVYDRSDAPVASVPEMGISLDLRRALRGEFAPTRLVLIRPSLRIVRTADGRFQFDVADTMGAEPTASGTTVVRELLDALQRPPGQARGPLSELREISVSAAALVVEDDEHGQVWHAPRADLALRRDEAGLGGFALLDVLTGVRTARLTADLRHRAGDGSTVVNARVENLDLRELAPRARALEPLSAVSMLMGGTATARFDRAFRITEGTVHLTGRDGVLDLPQLYDAPQHLPFAELRGRFDAARGMVVLDDVFADLGGPTARLAATLVDLGGGRIDVRGDAEVAGVPVGELERLWPPKVARNPRQWILANLSGGMAERATATFAAIFPADRPEDAEIRALDGEIRVAGVDVRYFGELPPVTGVSGVATFDTTRMDLSLDGGKLRDVAVGRSRVSITGLDGGNEAIDIEVPLSGPVRSILAVLDMPPLGYPARLGLDPAAASGRAAGTVTFAFPLLKDVSIDDVVFGAKAKLSDVTVDGVPAGRRISDGDLTLALDPGGIHIEGTARVDGIPATVAWREHFVPRKGIVSRITVAGVTSAEDRRVLGLDVEPWVAGPVAVDAEYVVPKSGPATLTARMDLAGAELDAGSLGWSKSPGVPASAEATVLFERGAPVRVAAFVLRGPGLDARGSAGLGEGGRVQAVNLDEVRVGATHLRLDADRRPDGTWRMSLVGPALDLGPVMEARDAEPDPAEDAGEPGVPFELSARLERVVLGEDQELRDVVAEAANDGSRWTRVQVDGRVGSATPVMLRYGPEGALRRLRFQTGNAGAVLRALGFFGSMQGGDLVLDATAPADDPQAPLEGGVEMTDFVLLDAPVLARLLNAASPTGFAELVEGKGINFKRLIGKWRYEGGEVQISEMRTSGAALGLTLEGIADLDADTVDVQGTIVPVYGVNRVIGAIPLLGQLLTGGEGQGVFAFTYAVAGPIADPRVTVNPLAVLAPGFLRTLFFLGPAPGDPAPAPVPPDEMHPRG
jgi:hypothetical protein